MSEKFQNKYRIPSTRLQNWDYGWNAIYFVTICTEGRECCFGDVIDGKMQLSEIGTIAMKYWNEIPKHFPFVVLDEFVVMPNHLHGIIIIDKPNNINGDDVKKRQCLVSTIHKQPPENISPKQCIGQKRFQNQGKNTLSSIIGSYKSVITKNARQMHSGFAWQARFHDHIIRNDISFLHIRNYIYENPAKWTDDKFFE